MLWDLLMADRLVGTLRSDEDTKTRFARPDADHSPATCWFWHHLPTRNEISRQVQEIYRAGFLTFLIQCRLAYPQNGYLDDKYLEACRFAVEQAHALGMTVGIYDEYNWQTGMAGGRTVHNRDPLREQHLFWTTAKVQKPTSTLWISDIHCSVEELGPAAMSWQFEGGRIEWTDWRIVAALLHPAYDACPGAVRDVTLTARIVSANTKRCRLSVKPSMDWDNTSYITVFASARCATSKVPNYLLPETASRFIEVGYEPYWKALAPYFGNTVKYFFFDQPHASFYQWRQHHGNLANSLPYSRDLAMHRALSAGGNLSRVLLALVMDVGTDTEVVRVNFYEAFADLATRTFLGPLKTWTAEHDVWLTGHEVLGHVGGWHPAGSFANWDLRSNFGMDYFAVDSYRDRTAVDAQGLQPQLSAKLGDSVARSHERAGCTVEQYFVDSDGPNPYIGKWGLSLEQLRAQALRLHLSGAKQFLMHAVFQTDGHAHDEPSLSNPRFDFAPGINFEPWWPMFPYFARESARLSAFIDAASPACEVAVLYPIRTAWAHGPQHSYGNPVAFWAEALAVHGYGYHFIDESDLIAARIDNGSLTIGKLCYRVLILPSVTMLQGPASLAAIERFLTNGGTVIASGETPRQFQHQAGSSGATWWNHMVPRYDRLIQFSDVPLAPDVLAILHPMRRNRPYLTSIDKVLWQWVGKDEVGWRVALFNDHQDTMTAHLHLPVPLANVERWETDQGVVTPIGLVSGATVEIRLDPMKLLCLRIIPATAVTNSREISSIGGPTVDELVKEEVFYSIAEIGSESLPVGFVADFNKPTGCFW